MPTQKTAAQNTAALKTVALKTVALNTVAQNTALKTVCSITLCIDRCSRGALSLFIAYSCLTFQSAGRWILKEGENTYQTGVASYGFC